MTLFDFNSWMNFYLLSAGHGEHGAAEPSFYEWLLSTNLFNILLILLGLGFVIKKLNLFGIFDTQQEKIRREIEQAEAQKQKALAELEEVKARTAGLNEEIDRILKDAESSAKGLSEQILLDARSQAEKIVEASKKRVEMEQKTAARTLERRLLEDALNDAQNLLSGIDDEEKSRSVEQFIDELSALK